MAERVTHLTDRKYDCHDRPHGTLDDSVPADATYDGVPRPEWIGVRWDAGGDRSRHPDANLVTCTCDGIS